MGDTENTMNPPDSSTPKLVQIVIKYSGGLIKNDTQARYFLFGFVIIAAIVSLILIFGGRGQTNFNPEDYPYGVVSPDET